MLNLIDRLFRLLNREFKRLKTSSNCDTKKKHLRPHLNQGVLQGPKDIYYDFINHMQEVLTQGGTRLILNHKAFKNLVQRYPERSLLSEYTNE
jgi:hypothetical protein